MLAPLRPGAVRRFALLLEITRIQALTYLLHKRASGPVNRVSILIIQQTNINADPA